MWRGRVMCAQCQVDCHFEVGSDPRNMHTGAQKVTVLFALIYFKILVSSDLALLQPGHQGCDVIWGLGLPQRARSIFERRRQMRS